MRHKRRREDRPQRNQPKVEGAEVRGVRGCLSHQQHRDHRNVTEGEALLWVTQVGNERPRIPATFQDVHSCDREPCAEAQYR